MLNTTEEINQKLANSIVLYNKKAWWVQGSTVTSVTDGLPPYISIVPARKSSLENILWISHNDPLLNYTNIKLGYVNFSDRKSYYVQRRAIRRSRQGIDSENIHILPLNAPAVDWESLPRPVNMVTHPSFADMLEGLYPSLDKAFDQLESGDRDQVAFSNKFALTLDKFKRISLVYKGVNEIGWAYKEKAFHLGPDWVREMCLEHKIQLKEA